VSVSAVASAGVAKNRIRLVIDAEVEDHEFNSTVVDAFTDLGYEVSLATHPAVYDREADFLAAAAKGDFVMAIDVRSLKGEHARLEVTYAPPNATSLQSKIEILPKKRVLVRTLVTLRQILSKAPTAPPTCDKSEPTEPAAGAPGWSRGRVLLVTSTAVFGFAGSYAIYEASQTDNLSVLFPLLALGTGVGIGTGFLVSEEWNITPSVASVLTAGTWWGVWAGYNFGVASNVQPDRDRFAWGLAGGLAGTVLSATTASLHTFSDNEAALIHSASGIGGLIGYELESIINGSVNLNFGWGWAIGTCSGYAAGSVGSFFLKPDITTSRILVTDLGFVVGTLAGVSIASPLLVKNSSPDNSRVFLASGLGGGLIGAGIAFALSKQIGGSSSKAAFFPIVAPTPHGIDAAIVGSF
jgi:hypothetical protein